MIINFIVCLVYAKFLTPNESINDEQFLAFQNNILSSTLPNLPFQFKVYGSIFQTAYYYSNIFLGAPNVSKASMIIDTGSSTVGLPCIDCSFCGKNHLDVPYDFSQSIFSSKVSCENCQICQLNANKQSLLSILPIVESYAESNKMSLLEATAIVLPKNADNMQCVYNVHYAEGSKITGLFYEDVYWLNIDMKDNQIIQNQEDSCSAFPLSDGPSLPVILPLGCHTEETHLFKDQKASGILGLEYWSSNKVKTFPTALLDNLEEIYGRKNITIVNSCEKKKFYEFEYMFALCLSPHGGSISYGGYNNNFHILNSTIVNLPLLKQKNKFNSYTVGLTSIEISNPRTYTPQINSHDYFQQTKDTSDWVNIKIDLSSTLKVNNDSKTINILPTLIDSGTTLTYFPVSIFTRLLYMIEGHVAINLRRRSKLSRGNYSNFRHLDSRIKPEKFFETEDGPAILKDRFMSKKEKKEKNRIQYIPIINKVISMGPKRLVKLRNIQYDSIYRNSREILQRQLDSVLLQNLNLRNLNAADSNWYVVIEPQNKMNKTESDQDDEIVGFLDIPNDMEGAKPRTLLTKLDNYNNGECWWLQDTNEDLSLFPMLRFQFYGDKNHVIWHPLSYLYSGKNNHFWCLSLMTDISINDHLNKSTDEIIFGSNSFIYKDIGFHSRSNNTEKIESELTNLESVFPYEINESAWITIQDAQCPIIKIEN